MTHVLAELSATFRDTQTDSFKPQGKTWNQLRLISHKDLNMDNPNSTRTLVSSFYDWYMEGKGPTKLNYILLET